MAKKEEASVDELDLEGLKKVVSEMLWPGYNPSKIMIDDLIREVERLREVANKYQSDSFSFHQKWHYNKDRADKLEKENAKLRERIERWRLKYEYEVLRKWGRT